MQKRRIIFDLDGTLLNGSFKEERDYFDSMLPSDISKIMKLKMLKYLYEFESKNLKYDVDSLSKFLSKKIGYPITPDFINGWIDINCTMKDILSDNIIDALEYLKMKEYSLVVLTNWFKKTQESRLKNAGLLKYFDSVNGGDTYVKPNKEAYINAAGIYSIEQCLMIGDDLQKDVIMPGIIGMDSIYYNPENKTDYNKRKILSIDNFSKVKEML